MLGQAARLSKKSELPVLRDTLVAGQTAHAVVLEQAARQRILDASQWLPLSPLQIWLTSQRGGAVLTADIPDFTPEQWAWIQERTLGLEKDYVPTRTLIDGL